jgi:hypothetical protein
MVASQPAPDGRGKASPHNARDDKSQGIPWAQGRTIWAHIGFFVFIFASLGLNAPWLLVFAQ